MASHHEEPHVDLELALQHGLTEEEYGMILKVLRRIPSYTELGIFSVMWSEHCSYKNSIAVLKTLPRSGGRLLVGAGEENAGLVDIGDGLAIAFKIESHNHPSAVEPYQGAATGVGGIMRDIFTMGARPIAALNSLRFGSLDDDRTRYLFKGVVRGIGDYGNSFGVPTVAGEIYFDQCYQENPLVNAMAVGLVKDRTWLRALAEGPGNPVLIVGSSTGRDGIHGATFASEEISEESESKRPSVQVGDPFTEKLLLEATLEAMRTNYIVGIQDMGAAGLTCSTSEMSAKGNSGMEINLDLVPAREEGMSAYELMLSESQERMLLVVKKGHEEDIRNIFQKWDLHAETIGQVIEGDRLIVNHSGRRVAEVSPNSLVLGGGAPVYIREAREPKYIQDSRNLEVKSLNQPKDLNESLMKLLSSPNIASKHWVYEQYDRMVRTSSIESEQADAAVVLLKETDKALALTTDCNSRYVYLNPYRGGVIAVAEAARNVVCSGATPLAITNCLNFGNPYKPEIYWQFREAVRGIGDACRSFNTPVTGGNVSFYNESPDGAVYPTPVIGMLGLIESLEHLTRISFRAKGDKIILLGSNGGHIGGSEYLKLVHGLTSGDAPELNLEMEKKVHSVCSKAIRSGFVRSAHDCSEGGVAVTIAESCLRRSAQGVGAQIDLSNSEGLRSDFLLFGEDQSRIILSCLPEHETGVLEIATDAGVEARVIGTVGGDRLVIGNDIDLPLRKLAEVFYGAIEGKMSEGILMETR